MATDLNATVDTFETHGVSSRCLGSCRTLDASSIIPHKEAMYMVRTEHPLWQSRSGSAMSRAFIAHDLQSALDAINAFAAIAEREGHHPDLHLTSSREVVIVLFTHKLKGITENDIKLAKMFDSEVKIAYSSMWLESNPQAVGTEIDPTNNAVVEPKEAHGRYAPVASRLDGVTKYLKKALPLWETLQGTAISKSFTAKNFQSCIDFMNGVGSIAMREGHCPDIHLTSYREMVVVISTADMACVTVSDVQLAKCIDTEVHVEYSPKWLKENPLAESTTKKIAEEPGPEAQPDSSNSKAPLLPMKELARIISNELPLWHSEKGFAMTRAFTAFSLHCALDAVNAFASIAEREQHHPDIHLTSGRDVVIVLYTRTSSGITEKDITLAKQFDEEIRIDYSPMWLETHPHAVSTRKESSSSTDGTTTSNDIGEERQQVHGENIPIGSRTDVLTKRLSHELPLWKTHQGTAISKSFVAKDFQNAIDFMNDVGVIAKREGHFPDFHLTSYRQMVVVLSTPDLTCVTESDVRIAKLIDSEVKVSYSSKWLKENPSAESTARN